MPRDPECWILLRRKQLDILGEIALGRRNGIGDKALRKRLTNMKRVEPTTATSNLLRSGDYVAVRTSEPVVQSVLNADTDFRSSATTLFEDAARAWGLRELDPQRALAAAPIRTRRPNASVRSVVLGGQPESARRRH